MNHDVVITGMGVISALGIGLTDNWVNAMSCKTGIKPIQTIPTQTLRTKLAGEAPNLKAQDYFPDIRPHQLDKSTLFSLISAQEALQDAGLTCVSDKANTGVMIGTCFSTIQTIESTYLQLAHHENSLSPLIFLKSMQNAASSEIAIRFGLKGINQTLLTTCSSATMALGNAYRHIKNGNADRILVGGTETPITPFMIKGWEKLHLISNCMDIKDLLSPFSLNRNGLILGEGAGFLVLESKKIAEKRQAKIYCSLIGFGTNCDAMSLSTPDANSQADAIRAALTDARLDKKDIHYINLHGTGTKMNDKVETTSIKKVWGFAADTIPMSATKSQIGHTMGACGAIESILTVMMMQHHQLLPTVHFQAGDPDCNLDYIPNQLRTLPKLKHAMKLSFGFGGSNAVLIFKK